MNEKLYYELCEEDWKYRKKQVEDGEITMKDAKFQHWMAVDDILWAMSDMDKEDGDDK